LIADRWSHVSVDSFPAATAGKLSAAGGIPDFGDVLPPAPPLPVYLIRASEDGENSEL